MIRSILILITGLFIIHALFILQGCTLSLTEESRGNEDQAKVLSQEPEPDELGRKLGTLISIYPIPRSDGDYDLELQMTADTVLVDFNDARDFAADSIGHALFLSKAEPFYTLNEECLYSPKKATCLTYTQAPKK